MFSHVFVGTDDLNKSRYFYDIVMPILGYGKCEYDVIKKRLLYISIDGVFGVTFPIDGILTLPLTVYQATSIPYEFEVYFKIKTLSGTQSKGYHSNIYMKFKL